MTSFSPRTITRSCLLAVLLVLCAGGSQGQGVVNVLRTGMERGALPEARADAAAAAERFTFERNLIFFSAELNGEPGSFILDTGAPTLVMNNRGVATDGARYTGMGAGGAVALTDHRVEQFEMLGRRIDNYWAIGVDLRDMERRTGKRIDGFVGYDLLNDGELRIDYAQRTFRMIPSTRRPQHEGKAPLAVLRFTLVDHLPVVQVRVDGKRYRFAIDTGAGMNLLAEWAEKRLPTQAGQRVVNVQGLDGTPVDCPAVLLDVSDKLGPSAQLELVTADMSHLQESGSTPLAGILGSPFLSRYVVGIDYRRQRIYLW